VPSLFIAGLILHVYGVLVIMLAGRTLWLINHIDYAAPVVGIQRELAELRRAYALSGMVVGLPWWLMWMPCLMALVGLVGVDVFARAPMVIYSGLAIGLAGLMLTWWFHGWSRQPSRPRLAKAMEDATVGRSLLRAQRIVDEVKRFEEEEPR
jgi:serine/threonine-protein kinase